MSLVTIKILDDFEVKLERNERVKLPPIFIFQELTHKENVISNIYNDIYFFEELINGFINSKLIKKTEYTLNNSEYSKVIAKIALKDNVASLRLSFFDKNVIEKEIFIDNLKARVIYKKLNIILKRCTLEELL